MELSYFIQNLSSVTRLPYDFKVTLESKQLFQAVANDWMIVRDQDPNCSFLFWLVPG